MDFDQAIKAVYSELASIHHPYRETDWQELSELNSLRNSLVHFKSESKSDSEMPRWFRALESKKLLAKGAERNWESRACVLPVAEWACSVVGDSILRLEEIPNRRTRSLADVRATIARLMDNSDPRLRVTVR
jgi:hypothetical protein